jgi:hypothetical protein
MLLSVSRQLSGGTDLGHNSPTGQCLVNNASMVLGLSSCVAYECAPQFVLRSAAVVIAIIPFVILHVWVHYRSLKSNN